MTPSAAMKKVSPPRPLPHSIVLAAATVLLLVIAAAVAGLLTLALSGVASAVGIQDQRSISDPDERSISDPDQFVLRR